MENQTQNETDQTAVDQATQVNATSTAVTENPSVEVPIDREQLVKEQHYLKGTLGALAAALLGAVAWAVVTIATGYQIGYMALAIGLLVGFANRFFGKGIELKFGITGALLALVGCLLGNVLSIVGFAATQFGMGYFEALTQIDYSLLPVAMEETFSPVDLLFYGIAMYEGFKFSFRIDTSQETNEL